MEALWRSILFRLDPETAHARALDAARLAGAFAPARAALARAARFEHPALPVRAFGLELANPVGLAAGYDKDGRAVRGLAALGFGHLELGTVTLAAQPGNPRPRVHRFAEERALVNSMGFPNAGIDALLARELDPRARCAVGINVGKRKDTPLEAAAAEYAALIARAAARADYVAVNVSSPNTPGLRQLQGRGALAALLAEVARARDAAPRRVPVLVKIAPDLSEAEVDDVLEAAFGAGIDGLIATNTTTDRAGLPERARALPGGASGAPLAARANAMMRLLARRTRGRMPLVGVGGILSPADAVERLRAGAQLVQVYTGLVYAGPLLVRAIKREIARVCEREGLASAAELGARAREG